jgi:NAD(P)-dependent dehydrogenase (short-subunit alcohol dehydrogenase family)
MKEKHINTILVTGAGQRIGRAIALEMGRNGWQVAIHFNSSSSDAGTVVDEITDAGGVAIAVQADLTDEVAVSSLIPNISRKLGPVSAVINNASIFEEDSVESATKLSWDNHMAVNLRAPFILIQSLVKHLPKTKKANVINILDQRVENLTPHFTTYTLSKTALWTLTKTAAAALAPLVRVNAIGPGPTLPSSRQSQEQFEKQVMLTPLQEQVSLTEICNAVQFILVSSSMTGQLLTLDSGQHLGWAQAGNTADLNE